MDKDLENKLDKLCLKYLKAQADISSYRPSELPTGRSRRKAQAQVVDVLSELQKSRKGPAASLVKLAYVRGMRSVDPEARMGQSHLDEVEFLVKRLDYELGKTEIRVLGDFRSHIRRLKLVRTLEGFEYPSTTLEALSRDDSNFPLEQYARESIRGIMGVAYDAGVSAASYDGKA